MIHVQDESLNVACSKLQEAMERFNKESGFQGKVVVTSTRLRHVAPEKQVVYLTSVFSTTNMSTLTERSDQVAEIPLKDTAMAALAAASPFGSWLDEYFISSDIVELNAIHSEILLNSGDKGVVAKLIRPGARPLLSVAQPTPDAITYDAPMGLQVTYDAVTQRLKYTLQKDATQQLLLDSACQDTSVEVKIDFEVSLRLTLRPEKEMAYLRGLLALQREMLAEMTLKRHPLGNLGGLYSQRRFNRAGIFQEQDELRSNMSVWLAIALKEPNGHPEPYTCTQDYLQARNMEHFGETPIRHTPRAGEGYGFQRGYASMPGGHLKEPQTPTAPEEASAVQPE